LQDAQRVVHGRHHEPEAVLHVEQHLAAVAVVADELVEGVAVGHPADDADVVAQGRHGVAPDGQVAPARLGVVGQERVDEAEELHDALVLAQVLVDLQQQQQQKARDL